MEITRNSGMYLCAKNTVKGTAIYVTLDLSYDFTEGAEIE